MLAVAGTTAVLCALIGHVLARCSATPDSFSPSEWIDRGRPLGRKSEEPEPSDPVGIQASLDRWQECTQLACRRHEFDGGHFYLQSQTESVVALINGALSAAQPL
jgi:hypothetical protein